MFADLKKKKIDILFGREIEVLAVADLAICRQFAIQFFAAFADLCNGKKMLENRQKFAGKMAKQGNDVEKKTSKNIEKSRKTPKKMAKIEKKNRKK